MKVLFAYNHSDQLLASALTCRIDLRTKLGLDGNHTVTQLPFSLLYGSELFFSEFSCELSVSHSDLREKKVHLTKIIPSLQYLIGV